MALEDRSPLLHYGLIALLMQKKEVPSPVAETTLLQTLLVKSKNREINDGENNKEVEKKCHI